MVGTQTSIVDLEGVHRVVRATESVKLSATHIQEIDSMAEKRRGYRLS